jgi:hypothetical protein
MSKARFLGLYLVLLAASAAAQVEFSAQKDSVLIRVNGKDFSTLRFGANRYKPYLRPLLTASGKAVTRGYPDDPQPGEILTIPHQVGLWVGFEKVNGYDFNELDSSYDKTHRRGKIVFKEIKKMQGGPDRGVLAFTADWVTPEGKVLIEQDEELTIYADSKDGRTMDVKFVLHPKDRIAFEDENDGIAGLRLGAPFMEENGGRVFNFTGTEGANQVIGKRSPWIEYEGTLDGGEKVGVMIMDHPDNYNFPLRWKVRPWGLIYFSSFGEHEFYEEKSPPYDKYHGVPPNGVKDMGLTLKKDEALTFQFRLLIHPLATDLNAEWLKFAKTTA